ncbi:MAG: hypothetical protein ING44_15835 [Telmatospirillum sp.]|nr:hypothetical protein [Telmatospirillum sp.]
MNAEAFASSAASAVARKKTEDARTRANLFCATQSGPVVAFVRRWRAVVDVSEKLCRKSGKNLRRPQDAEKDCICVVPESLETALN